MIAAAKFAETVIPTGQRLAVMVGRVEVTGTVIEWCVDPADGREWMRLAEGDNLPVWVCWSLVSVIRHLPPLTLPLVTPEHEVTR